MGLLNNLMPGESGGMPDQPSQPQSGFEGLLNGGNSLFNLGMGILANNTGHYGAFAPALGMGAQQGMQANQQYQQLTQQQQLNKMKMDEYKRNVAKQTAQDAFLKNWGNPNSTKDVTSPASYQNAPQGSDAPNFNMQQVAGTTTSTPVFDQSKALQQAVQSGALDFKDYLAMTAKDDKYTYQNTGSDLTQIDSHGQPTGLKLPMGYTPDATLPYKNMTANEQARYQRPDANAVLSSNTSMSNTASNNRTSIQNNNSTQAGENSRSANKDNNPWLQGAPAPSNNAPKKATLQDIADTAKKTGYSTARVTADLKSQGYQIGK